MERILNQSVIKSVHMTCMSGVFQTVLCVLVNTLVTLHNWGMENVPFTLGR